MKRGRGEMPYVNWDEGRAVDWQSMMRGGAFFRSFAVSKRMERGFVWSRFGSASAMRRA